MSEAETLSVSKISESKISETFDIPGYVLNKEILERVDTIANQAVRGSTESSNVQTIYWIKVTDKDMRRFETLNDLLQHLDSEPLDISSISLQHIVPVHAGINLQFQRDGTIDSSAYSNSVDFQFNMDRLSREIKRCDQDYNWFIRTVVLKYPISRIIGMLVVLFSIFLLSDVGYYFYAQNAGVNVDPSLIPSGNEHYQKVEEAIKSKDISQKMNILLSAQLRNFKNVKEILIEQQKRIHYIIIGIIVTTILYFITKFFNNLYPLAYFAFTPQLQRLSEINRKREIVWVAVIISFILNLVAGIAVPFIY